LLLDLDVLGEYRHKSNVCAQIHYVQREARHYHDAEDGAALIVFEGISEAFAIQNHFLDEWPRAPYELSNEFNRAQGESPLANFIV
jgi:hypothetical protein